ncbi:MAG TPA: carbonic anhydrase family protein [Terracidiphilus sp.]|nr:carbonic anhydrase family protein [Terracidiphilus sp.]
MRLSARIALTLAAAALALTVATQACAQSNSWTYEGKTGPVNWGRVDPSYRACSDGRKQSPIDVRHAHLNKALPPIEFHYIAGGVTLENNGHTIMVRVHPGSYIVAGGVRYDLIGYDFHHPSEESVNGRLADMDVEFLHKSADGKFAIIEERLTEDIDEPNPTLAMLWGSLPTTTGASDKVTSMVNPLGLLPVDQSYWTYMGSLSTPPCTEDVRWFVMQTPVTISRGQYRAFAALFRVNSRPLQDTHGRRIEATR